MSYDVGVDSLRQGEIDQMRSTSPEEKARQALDLMRTGIDLKRAALRTRHPGASEEELERLLDAWLAGDG